MGEGINTRTQLISVYREVYELWQQHKVKEAEQVLQWFWHDGGEKTLRNTLLMAYIYRDQKRYLTEVRWLQQLLQAFDGADDKALLADAWSILGSALRMLGEGNYQ